jgi:hypothetical protein
VFTQDLLGPEDILAILEAQHEVIDMGHQVDGVDAQVAEIEL